MRKSLLSLAISMIALSSSAQELVLSQPATLGFPASNTTTFKAPAMRAATENPSEFDFCLCYPPVTSLGLNTTGSIGGAMQLDNATVTHYAGAKVTAILIANGSAQNIANPKPQPITLFSATELGKTDVMTMEGNMDLKDSYAYKEYPLETPITLEAGKPLWFGFTCTPVGTSYYPLVLDMSLHDSTDQGGYVGVKTSNAAMSWNNYASNYGFTCIKVRLETENAPLNEIAILGGSIPQTASSTSPFDVNVILASKSANTIENVDYTVSINGTQQEGESNISLPAPLTSYNDYEVISLPVQCATEGADVKVEVNITKVNGSACTNPYKISGTLNVLDGGFKKAMVIEEGTGTWCGFCPRGIVGIETICKAHPDGNIIPIAVHNGNDPMVTASYSGLWSYIQSFPGAMINRDSTFGAIDPNADKLESVYQQLQSAISVANVVVTEITEDTDSATISGYATFAIDIEKSNYKIACVAMEDHVGPYAQLNSFAGGSYGAMAGWEKKSSRVTTYYEDVAREINNFNGITGFIPTNITKGEQYPFTSKVCVKTVKNMDYCHYAVLLINKSGVIENAAAADGPAKTGIEQPEMTESAADAPVRYFNLQGREVAAPAEGQLLIKLQGSRSEKIIF